MDKKTSRKTKTHLNTLQYYDNYLSYTPLKLKGGNNCINCVTDEKTKVCINCGVRYINILK